MALLGTFKELHSAGCIQTGADSEPDVNVAFDKFRELFAALSLLTNNDPCDGCPALNGGKCKAFQQFNTRSPRRQAANAAQAKRTDRNRGPHKPRCPKCGLKFRGAGHEYGPDHIRRASRAGR